MSKRGNILDSLIDFKNEKSRVEPKATPGEAILTYQDWGKEKKLCESRKTKDLPFVQPLPISKENKKKDSLIGLSNQVATHKRILSPGRNMRS